MLKQVNKMNGQQIVKQVLLRNYPTKFTQRSRE